MCLLVTYGPSNSSTNQHYSAKSMQYVKSGRIISFIQKCKSAGMQLGISYFKQTFYMPILCSYPCKIIKLYSIISNYDNVMPYWQQTSSEFLHFTWKTRKNAISATAWPIFTKFNVIMQKVSPSNWLLKISVSEFQDGRQPPSKNQIAISMMIQNGSLKRFSRPPSWISKLKF